MYVVSLSKHNAKIVKNLYSSTVLYKKVLIFCDINRKLMRKEVNRSPDGGKAPM